MYAEFKRPVRMAYIKRLFNEQTIHLEARQGTRDQARDYCMKADSRVQGPWEFGLWTTGGQGTRTDLTKLKDMAIDLTKTERTAWEEEPSLMVKYHKAFSHCRALVQPTVRPKLKVHLLIGDTGCFKTRWCWHSQPTLWPMPLGNKTSQGWFCGYDGQEAVLIDDYAGEFPLKMLLKLLDIYPVQAPTKGSHVWFTPETILMTSNEHPDYWYDYSRREKSKAALMRRFLTVTEIPEGGCICADGTILKAPYSDNYQWPGDRPPLRRQNATLGSLVMAAAIEEALDGPPPESNSDAVDEEDQTDEDGTQPMDQ